MSAVRETLARIVGDYVLIDAVDITDDADLICDLGLAVVDLITLAGRIVSELKIAIEATEATEWKTFGDLVVMVEARVASLAAMTTAEQRMFVGIDPATLDRLTQQFSAPIEALIARWPRNELGGRVEIAALLRALLINQARIIVLNSADPTHLPGMVMDCEGVVREHVRQLMDKILLEIARG